MSKRYRLKRDSPDSKAGTILTQVADSDYEYIANGGYDSFYYKDQVENSPDWFELIEEPKEVFTWDDKLACEWAGYLEEVLKIGTSTSQIPAILRMWKERHKSKTKPLPKDVFEVKAVFCSKGFVTDQKVSGVSYIFEVVGRNKGWFSSDKFQPIKQAIEAVLNNDDREYCYKVERNPDGSIRSFIELKYSQPQMDKGIEDAFNAARKPDDGIFQRSYSDPSYIQHFFAKHPTFQSYLDTLKK